MCGPGLPFTGIHTVGLPVRGVNSVVDKRGHHVAVNSFQLGW